MKRLLALLLSCIFVLLLVSCSKDEEPMTPERVKSINDIYSLDEQKLNFSTLYVVKNESGIVTLVFDTYEHWQDYEGEPKWMVVKVRLGDISTSESNSYNIISFTGDMSPTKLQLGDELICHHDYTLMSQIYPAEMIAYNLFFTGNHKQIDTYLDYPDENGIPTITQ